MPKVYDPILCMMVDEPTKARDELSLAQKKQVVVELKGYLKKSYNFSDESEYARAYEDLRRMFTTGSRKSISGLFENTVKKTGAHDAKARDVAPATQRYINKAIKTVDGATGDKLYADVKAIYNLFSNILLTYSNEQSVQKLANEGTKKCLELAAKVKGVRDEATRTTDAANLKGLKDDYGRLKNASSIIGNIYSLSSSTKSAILKAIESGMREIDTLIDRAYMK